jgi:tetratricopeptide (TPR) repeat protein
MVDESARWRAQRQATLNKRYIVHYLLFLEEHSATSIESFDTIERERANILAALEQSFQGRRWARVQRFTNILCPPDGFLAVRGYWAERNRNLSQAIELATTRGDGLSAAKFTQWLEDPLSSARDLESDMDEEIEERLRGLREQIVLAKASAVMFHMFSGDNKLREKALEHNYSQSGLSTNELFLRIDPVDWPDSYRATVRRKAKLLSHWAVLAVRRGDLQQAKQCYQETLQDLKQVGNEEEQAVVMANLSIVLRGLGDNVQANALLESASDLSSVDDLRAGIMMAHEAVRVQQAGDLIGAEQLIQQSYDVSARLGYKLGQSQILRGHAMFLKLRSEYDEARRLIQESITIDTELGNTAGVSRAWRLMGDVAAHANDLAEADSCYDTAFRISQELGDHHESGALLSERGALAFEAGALQIAEDFYQRSLGFLEDTVSRELCKCLRRLGLVADHQNELGKAKLYYQRATDVADKLGSDEDLARSLFNLAGVLDRCGDMATAESLFSRTVVVARRL